MKHAIDTQDLVVSLMPLLNRKVPLKGAFLFLPAINAQRLLKLMKLL